MSFKLQLRLFCFLSGLLYSTAIVAHNDPELTFSRGNSVSTDNMVIKALPGRSFIIGGSVYACRTPALHRIDEFGNLSTFSAFVGNGYVKTVLPLKDSTYIMGGKFDEFILNPGYTNLVRIDAQGKVAWDLKYSNANSTPPSVNFTHGFDNLAQTSDGSIYATVADNALIKLHLDGSESWAGLIDSASAIYGMVNDSNDLLMLTDKGIIRVDSSGNYKIINRFLLGHELFKLNKDSFALLSDGELTVMDAQANALGSYSADAGQVLTHGCYANGFYYLSFTDNGTAGVMKIGPALTRYWLTKLDYDISINGIAANDVTISIAGTEHEPVNKYALTRAHHGFVKYLSLSSGTGQEPTADIGITALSIDSVGEIPDHNTFGDFAMLKASVTVKNFGSEPIDSFFLDWQAPLDSVSLTDSCNMTSLKYVRHLEHGDSVVVKYDAISFLHVHNVDFQLGMVMNTASPNGRLDANTANDIFQKQYTIHTGLKENSFNNAVVDIYPNPFSTHFDLHSQQAINARLEVMNSVGKTVLVQQLYNTFDKDIDLSALPKGIYFIKLSDGRQQMSREIVKQ